jgi:D-alanyl-D-alanine carboxypeptidase (penicillin-binding protein 5/6)
MPTATPTAPRVVSVPPRRRRSRRVLSAAVAVLVAVLGTVSVAAGSRLARPLPEPQVTLTLPESYTVPGTPPALPWPAQGQAALAVVGVGSLGTSGAAHPAPIASVAKVMTAYAVLADHPLAPGEAGPTMTVSAADAAAYPAQLAANQSLVRVTANEVLTERQALQALLLPSADNIAHLLARWDAGSTEAFLVRMNATAAKLGMADTHYTDPSGLDKSTVSTAVDQLKLAEQAMKVPALAEIVAMTEATIPVAGLVKNYNTLLGHDGVIGIKTGSTLAAGGCLVFAVRLTVGGRNVLVLGAVLGQTGTLNRLLPLVFAASQKLIQAVTPVVGMVTVVRAGQPLGTVRGPLGTGTGLVAGGDVAMLGWPGLTVRTSAHVTVPKRVGAGASVGTVEAAGAQTSVVTTGALTPPDTMSRLTG